MDLEQKSFYYLDPYGPSRSSRGAFAAVKLVSYMANKFFGIHMLLENVTSIAEHLFIQELLQEKG